MVRSIKNTFAPINRIPPEVLSLIPDYCDKGEGPITLTHVCHYWREIFISRASLWTFLNCSNLYKTRVYIERSRGSPLEIYFITLHHHDAFLLTIPHIGRFKTLTLYGPSGDILRLTEHFGSPAPLLEKLEITALGPHPTVLKSSLFGGNLSSLHELYLSGALIDTPWQNLSNLTTFDFRWISGNKISVTQLLDCFEHAPLLRKIQLMESLPDSSNAPIERAVSLLHLRLLEISAHVPHSILLNHLLIPTGAFMVLRSGFGDGSLPIPDHLPGSLDNLGNISHTTSISIHVCSGIRMWFNGPSGGLYVDGSRFTPYASDDRIFWPLNHFRTSTTERLAISQDHDLEHPEVGESGAYRILLLMNNLRTLRLTGCIILSFVLALNPDRNVSSTVVCPGLQELILIGDEEGFFTDELLEMAKGRASRGAKLSTISIIYPREFISAGVFNLEGYASRVEHRMDATPPTWDTIPDVLCKADINVRALIGHANGRISRLF